MPNRLYGEYPVLLWWAECVDLLSLLAPRNRARVLSLLADGVCRSAARPDQQPSPVGPVDRLSQHRVRVHSRTWRCLETELGMRIIG